MLTPFRSFQTSTGKPFFHKRLHKEVNNLRVHIAKGCLSDPIDAAMYAHDGKTLHGLDKTRSLRSTNRVENLHTPLRSLLGGKNTGVRLAHSTLLVYNYRRNHRMAGTVNILRAPTQAFFYKKNKVSPHIKHLIQDSDPEEHFLAKNMDSEKIFPCTIWKKRGTFRS